MTQARSILDTLQQRAWLEGLAWFALSKSGNPLERSIVDVSVASPERLMFEAPPILDAPVIRLPRPVIVKEGIALSAPALPLEAAAKARATTVRAREAIKPQSVKVERAYFEARATEQAVKTGVSVDTARQTIRRMMQGAILSDDYLLDLKDGTTARVGDLLDAGDKFDRLSLPDPVEGLSYGPDKATLLIQPRPGHPDEKPRLVSHAHGVRTVYKFARFEAPPQPPFHPGPDSDRQKSIKATGDAVRGFFDAVVPPIRASRMVGNLYAEIPEDAPEDEKRRAQRQVRLQVRRDLNLDYTPTARPGIAESARRQMIYGSQGVGKSAALVGDGHKAHDRPAVTGALHSTAGLVSLVLAPDHAMTAELAADYEANRTSDSPPAFILRGRSQPDTITGKNLCWIPKAAEKLAKKGGNVRGTLCAVCPFADQCGYLRNEAELVRLTKQKSGVVIFAPQEFAFLPLPRGTTPDLIVIDEALRDHGVVSHKIDIASLSEPLKAEGTNAAQSFIGRVAEQADAAAANLQFIQPLRVALRDGFIADPTSPYAVMLERGLTLETIAHAIKSLALFEESEIERRTKETVQRWEFAQMDAGRGKSLESVLEAALDEHSAKQARKIKALFEAVQKDLAKGHNSPSAAYRPTFKGKRADHILTADLAKPFFSAKTPLLHLDGTACPQMAEAVFGPMTCHHFPVERNADVTQITGHSFTIGSLTGTRKDGTPLSAKSVDEARSLRRKVVDLVSRQANPLTIASARVEAMLIEDGIPGQTAHYRALRGRNDWEACETVIIAGPEMPPPHAIEATARAYAANDPKAAPFESIGDQRYPKEARALRMADKSVQMIDVSYHPDPWAELILRQKRDAEILQALDRIRLIHNAEPKRVIILAPVVLDVTVNDVTPWSEAKQGGDRVQLARDLAGVVPLSKHAALKLFPGVWKSTGMAVRDLKPVNELVKSLLVHSPINIYILGKWTNKKTLLCAYKTAPKKDGKRARAHRALIWADTPDQARQNLEALTGPLNSFEVVDGWAEARDAALDARKERAAIAEHDGGLNRPDAERLADRAPIQATNIANHAQPPPAKSERAHVRNPEITNRRKATLCRPQKHSQTL